MTQEVQIKDLDEANKWCNLFGIPPVTSYEIKMRDKMIKRSWGMAYTRAGIEYFVGNRIIKL